MGLTARRILGGALLAATYVPLHRLLAGSVTGLAGRATYEAADAAWRSGLLGTLMVGAVALALARLAPARLLERLADGAARTVERPSSAAYATMAGSVAFLLAGCVGRILLGGLPVSVDAMVQLLHARALESGAQALPLPGPEAAWIVQNSVLTPHGLASVYPPLHTLILAAALAAGPTWLVGPVATGATVGVACLVFERTLQDVRTARFAGALVAVSPFVVFLGGTHLSHTTAAAFGALTVWSAFRARDGGALWGLATGCAVGALVCTRPWVGLALSAVILCVLWVPAGRRSTPWLLRRAGALMLGGLPWAAFLMWWNRRLFGGPLTLGYSAAFGSAHGLGFHTDPWGNTYGPAQALGYTGADLVQLGTHLMESPLPALAVIGLALLLSRRLNGGSGVLVAWTLAVVGANALYWHHGILMGPRFLYESAPAWAGLWVASVAVLASPDGGLSAIPRYAIGWAALLSVVGGLLLVPGRAASYGVTPSERLASHLPVTPPGAPSLVFVHGSWPSRIAARLVAAGVRRDSVETALRRNDVCAVEAYARWREVGGANAPALDFEPLPGAPASLESRVLAPGERIRVDPARARDPRCSREARSDRLGTLELEPLLWQSPPLPGAPIVLARDLGPQVDQAVREGLPGRVAYIFVADAAEGARLLSYEEGMRILWEDDLTPTGG